MSSKNGPKASSGSKRSGSLTKDDIQPMVAKMSILAPKERKRNERHRMLCKVDRCNTQARSEKDDMCKKHFGWFKLVGRETKDAPTTISSVSNESNHLQAKELNQTPSSDCADGLEVKTKLTAQTQLSQPKKSMQSTNIDNNHRLLVAAVLPLPKQLVQSGNTATKHVDTHNSNATDADKSVAPFLDENKAAELEEDLFRLVDQTIDLDYQWNERLNELDEPNIELCESPSDYGVPGEGNEQLCVVDGNIDESLEGMVAVSSRAGSGIYKRQKKRGRAEDDSKGSRKGNCKDKDMDKSEENQDIVVLGFATCNKCDMIFANVDAAWNHEDICPGDTAHALADEIMSSLVDTSGGMAPTNEDDLSLLTCMLGRKDRLGKRSVKITRKYAEAVSDGLL